MLVCSIRASSPLLPYPLLPSASLPGNSFGPFADTIFLSRFFAPRARAHTRLTYLFRYDESFLRRLRKTDAPVYFVFTGGTATYGSRNEYFSRHLTAIKSHRGRETPWKYRVPPFPSSLSPAPLLPISFKILQSSAAESFLYLLPEGSGWEGLNDRSIVTCCETCERARSSDDLSFRARVNMMLYFSYHCYNKYTHTHGNT